MFRFLQIGTIEAEDIVSKSDSVMATFEQFAQGIVKDPEGTLHTLGQDFMKFGLKLLAAIAIYLIGAWLIKRVRKGLQRLFARKETDKALSTFILSLATITLTIILVVITVGTLGVDTTSLAALLAAGGVAIGMALSGTVQNFAGGIMILAFKPFKAGDYIEAQGYAGTVTAVTIVSTYITTIDNRSIVIPNGALFNGNIDNYSKNDFRRIDWTIGVEYGTDADKVIEKLLQIVNDDDRVCHLPMEGIGADPFVGVAKLSESSVDFVVKVWVRSSDYWDLFYEMNKRFYTELPAAGIRFPFPQVDVHLRQS